MDGWMIYKANSCVFLSGKMKKKGFLCYVPPLDLWSELLPTLTRADADLPTLYFLGAADKLFVIGGNNSENVMTSFCVESKKWGEVSRQKRT